eukprot:scaffold166030_cov32-Prasinocladus_malaysianus.AAC.5
MAAVVCGLCQAIAVSGCQFYRLAWCLYEQVTPTGGDDLMVRIWTFDSDGVLKAEPVPLTAGAHRPYRLGRGLELAGDYLARASDDSTVRARVWRVQLDGSVMPADVQ